MDCHWAIAHGAIQSHAHRTQSGCECGECAGAMAVDNVRLYPNPAHNPATIIVYTGVSGGKPKTPIHNQKIQIFEEGSKRLLGEALTDEGGEGRALLRTDVLYPVAATIIVSDGADGTAPIVQARIPRKGVDGLYPGDVWALDLRHKRVQ